VPLYDYFRAADLDQALAIALAPGGPCGREGVAAGVDALSLKHVDPPVVMGKLLALVRGVEWSIRLYDRVTVWPTGPKPRAAEDFTEDSPWVTGPWVEDLGTAFRDSIAAVDDSRLPEISGTWQSIEELEGCDASTWALEAVGDVVELARRARAANESIYCWMCL
jgi:hypothetical protein